MDGWMSVCVAFVGNGQENKRQKRRSLAPSLGCGCCRSGCRRREKQRDRERTTEVPQSGKLVGEFHAPLL